jgi:hypothetical protein
MRLAPRTRIARHSSGAGKGVRQDLKSLVLAAALLLIAGGALAQLQVSCAPFEGVPSEWSTGPGTAYGPQTVWDSSTQTDYYYSTGSTTIGTVDDGCLGKNYLIDGFAFAYYDPAGGSALTTAEVKFYDGTFLGTHSLAAYFRVTDLPGDGTWTVAVNLQGGYEFPLGGIYPDGNGSDMMMAVCFMDSDEAGQLITYGPSIGNDWFFTEDPWCTETMGGWYWFGGDPHADFYWQLYVCPEPAQVSLAAVLLGLGGIFWMRRR